MFFFLSKILGYFAQPLFIIGIFLIVFLVVKNALWKKRLVKGAIILFFFFTNGFISNEVIGLWETPVVPLSEIKKQYEWGIVLTGVTTTNMVLKDRVYISSSPDRLNHTVMLYRKGLVKKILVSGGSGQLLDPSYSEANQLRSVFILMGIKEEDLLIEGNSRNTYENAIETKKILNQTEPKNCLLITSAYHMPRSLACFRKINFECDIFPTDLRFHQREYTPDALLIPEISALANWQTIFKELTGLIAYKIAGYA